MRVFRGYLFPALALVAGLLCLPAVTAREEEKAPAAAVSARVSKTRIDFEVGNWFTSTHPRSPFVLNLTVQRIVENARHTLRNLTYSITRGTAVQVHEITRQEVVPLLRDVFGLEVPEDATFRALDSKLDR